MSYKQQKIDWTNYLNFLFDKAKDEKWSKDQLVRYIADEIVNANRHASNDSDGAVQPSLPIPD